MDALGEHREEVEQVLAGLPRPLVDRDLAVPFYDMTTIRTEGLSNQTADVRHSGMSKEGVIARQVMLGVVQTADGLPLYHEVFDGNTAEVTTLKPILEKIVQRFLVKRVIAVADRGLPSTDNLAELQAITLPSTLCSLPASRRTHTKRRGADVVRDRPLTGAWDCGHSVDAAQCATSWPCY